MASISDASEEDALLRARIEDACHLCDVRSCPRFVGFLDEHRQAVARAVLREKGVRDFLFFGGYPDAERTVLGVFPSFLPPEEALFPVRAVAFRYRTSAEITHRDVLGSLLGVGIRRDKVGDIICRAGEAVVLVDEELAPFLAESVTKIGREGVKSVYPYTEPITVVREFKEWQDTVPSPRLDAVLHVALRTSREEAARRIAAGAVLVDHLPTTSPSLTVAEGAILSVRGVGRFRVAQIGPPTKKGRLFVRLQQYI